jgi:hypothetical protein
MEKNTATIMEKLFRLAVEGRMKDGFSSFTKSMHDLTDGLNAHEKKEAMKVMLSLGKAATVSFFDKKLADLDRGPSEDGDGV